MSQPKIAARKPAVLELEPKKYFWCACGESKNQPFCDGSHAAKGIYSPLPITITEKKKVALCQCKQTKNPPFCDGTHAKLPE
ncbi:MAG: CDGSH iron-sulfur domain-containing protein [Polyangia bacterium]|jgi:CDGSH-type Zn-finger protein|nr:CDGSH iron-sulfur domain-containing protein [Polyangia bacterium]